MQTSISSRELKLEDDLTQYTQDKIVKLEKYRNDIIGVEVTLLENHHQKEKKVAFIAKALVKIPGNDIKAESHGKTLFAAVDNLENKLVSQLKKSKEKRRTFKRGRDFLGKFFGKE